jgi:hypothetical protein
MQTTTHFPLNPSLSLPRPDRGRAVRRRRLTYREMRERRAATE